jgi:hypothetical protein
MLIPQYLSIQTANPRVRSNLTVRSAVGARSSAPVALTLHREMARAGMHSSRNRILGKDAVFLGHAQISFKPSEWRTKVIANAWLILITPIRVENCVTLLDKIIRCASSERLDG